ncbi:hypothetical protein SDC9_184165 [bioreactor metagenome]|uniref:Uncharacterized protein n=1 Tax=bioreactor metagenome TaxID=1076179 RepID=A0A645HC99_9ZZZZ
MRGDRQQLVAAFDEHFIDHAFCVDLVLMADDRLPGSVNHRFVQIQSSGFVDFEHKFGSHFDVEVPKSLGEFCRNLQ